MASPGSSSFGSSRTLSLEEKPPWDLHGAVGGDEWVPVGLEIVVYNFDDP